MRKYRNNITFSRHWTEKEPAVLSFLKSFFQAEPEETTLSISGDVLIGGRSVEIKSCLERIRQVRKTGTVSTRRGRFTFNGHEGGADYVLFVLVRSSGALDMALVHRVDVPRLGESFTINYKEVFRGDSLGRGSRKIPG